MACEVIWANCMLVFEHSSFTLSANAILKGTWHFFRFEREGGCTFILRWLDHLDDLPVLVFGCAESKKDKNWIWPPKGWIWGGGEAKIDLIS